MSRLGRPASTNTVLTAIRLRVALPVRFPRVRVDVEFGEVARRDVEPDAVAGLEEIGRGQQVHRDAHDLAGLAQARVRGVLGIAQPHDAVGEDHRIAARVVPAGRIDVDKLRREIGVRPVRRDEELRLDRADDPQRRRERCGLEDEHVGARGERQIRRLAPEECRPLHLVECAADRDGIEARQIAADRRHRMGGIVIVGERRRIAVWRIGRQAACRRADDRL